MPVVRKPGWRRLDVASISGVPLGIGLVVLGLMLEGGTVRSLMQLTAAVIVFGGTLGAVVMSFGLAELRWAVTQLRTVFLDEQPASARTVATVVAFATKARRRGLVAIEHEIDDIDDWFLRRGLSLAVDGHSPDAVRDVLDVEDQTALERDEVAAQVYDAAGGYAPTLGILGAVLGLIQVMGHLSEPDELGAGIAVAFVATVYGVGSANLVFLPIATKLRAKAHDAERHRALVAEGVLAIQQDLHPQLIEAKLEALVDSKESPRQSAHNQAA